MFKKLVMLIVIMIPTVSFSQSMDALRGLASSDAVKEASASMGGSVTDLLSSQLGLTSEQAEGGVGSMLTLASEKLVAGDFDKIADMIPGASGYMDKAKSLGAVAGPLGDLAGLNSALGSLGISPDMVSQFVPMVTKYLGGLGGSDISALLSQVF